MATVEFKTDRDRYDILIAPGLLAHLGQHVRRVAPHDRAILFADQAVMSPHGEAARQSLQAAGYQTPAHTLPPGEEHKNLDTVRTLYDHMVAARLERQSPVVALGGGVLGDTVGFAAATFLRGLPLIHCPTTLLAMVDASVGGKTGVNLPQGKNLVGAFHQPRLVLADIHTLATLPDRELRCGLAECVKHSVIRDPALFSWIQTHLDHILTRHPDTLVELVRWNVQIKTRVVAADEKEAADRAHLNFGHTFGHAIEAATHYSRFHHGETVSLGMVAATRLAVDLHRCTPDLLDQLTTLLHRIGLPTHSDQLGPIDTLLDTMRLDKKIAAGRLRLILPDRLGSVSTVSDVPDAAILRAWQHIAKPMI
jgi:3-dehydroquinate synthase